MAFTTRRDTYFALREPAMSVDVIHAVMGVVYLLTWACIGQMNVHRRTDSEAETNRQVHWTKTATPTPRRVIGRAKAARPCEAHS